MGKHIPYLLSLSFITIVKPPIIHIFFSLSEKNLLARALTQTVPYDRLQYLLERKKYSTAIEFSQHHNLDLEVSWNQLQPQEYLTLVFNQEIYIVIIDCLQTKDFRLCRS